MYALIYLTLFLYSNAIAENVTYDANENDCVESTVNDVADQLLDLLGIKEDGKDSDRIKELKERRKKTLNYAYDKENYNILFLQELRDTDLNETNFYKAMHEKDHFQTVSNQSKNLFLKLKERMNRDDIVQILANSRKFSSRKSARRMLGENFVARSLKDRQMEDVVDKIIAEVPHDDHKYDESDRYSKYWDPDRELKDRQEYHQHDGRRIFKGERTNVRWYPFMVSIHVMSRFWCGGSIYWKDMIITSAACLQLMHNNRFFRENPRVLNVRVGSNHSRVSGEVIPALEVYFHPGYNPKTLKNNIALIRLNKLLCVTKHSVPKMIALHHNPGGVSFTGEVLLLGWGVTKKSQKMAYEPIFLQRKILPIYPNTFCKEIYGNRFISESMFCAGTMTTGEGACDHDAGGPAIMYGKLVGIISFGPTICGYPNTPTVFTLVGAFADWIETVNESMPGYYRNIKYKTSTTTEKTMPTIETRKGIIPFTTPKSIIIFSDSYDMVSGVSVITVDEGQPLPHTTEPVVVLADAPPTPKPAAGPSDMSESAHLAAPLDTAEHLNLAAPLDMSAHTTGRPEYEGCPRPRVSTPGRPKSGVSTTGHRKSGVSITGRPKYTGYPKPRVSTTKRPKMSVTTTGRPKSSVSTTGRRKSGVSTTGCPKSALSTTKRPKSGVSTTIRPKSDVSTTGRPKPSVSTTGQPQFTISASGLWFQLDVGAILPKKLNLTTKGRSYPVKSR